MIDGISGGDMVYNSLQLKGSKSFSSGYTLLVAYNYHIQTNQDVLRQRRQLSEKLDFGRFRYTPSPAGGFGYLGTSIRQRPPLFLRGLPVVGSPGGRLEYGWISTWHSGTLLNFGGMLVNGDPKISNPGPNAWFNAVGIFDPSGLHPAHQSLVLLRHPRTSILQHRRNAEQGFQVTERIRFQLHMDAFNAMNNMNWNNPNMTVGSSQFGKSTDIYSQDYGRRLQLGLKMIF